MKMFPFNRTSMELKLPIQRSKRIYKITFNRTSMELKRIKLWVR